MFFTDWFTEQKDSESSALNDHEPQPRRQPIHAHPSLEGLEERTLLSAASGLVGGSFHNLNLNSNYNAASNGSVSPIQNFSGPTANGAEGSNGIHAVDPSGRVSSGTIGEASSAAFFAQDQLYTQFRVFGINSLGDTSQIGQQTTLSILRDAYGFGSGTQPNAPWKPNAYNLGLANHQPDSATQLDNGFSSAPASPRQWVSPVAQSQSNKQNQPLADDQSQLLNKDELGIDAPEQGVAKRVKHDEEPSPQEKWEKNADDNGENVQALIEQQTSEKKAPIENAMREDGTLPDSLWLSALAPAPMAALIGGLPGMAIAAEGGEVEGEAPE